MKNKQTAQLQKRNAQLRKELMALRDEADLLKWQNTEYRKEIAELKRQSE